MCAHSGYFKICQCALVGLVEEFCCVCHLEITSRESASDLIFHMLLCIEDTLSALVWLCSFYLCIANFHYVIHIY